MEVGSDSPTSYWQASAVRSVHLYFNELPFCHFFQHIDGDTTIPKAHGIGKMLNDCEKLQVVSFQSINCEIPEVDRQIHSKD